MIIPRLIKSQIKDKLANSNKIVTLFGARQVGKTTLSEEIVAELGIKTLSVNGGNFTSSEILSSQNLDSLKEFVSGYDLLFIDEAQKIQNIGENLKLLHDYVKSLKILVTGSSSFDLANKISEPLTGRKWNFTLFPIAISELKSLYNDFEIKQKVNSLLVWGSYPEIFQFEGTESKKNYLMTLTSDYLYKDILELSGIRNSNKINNLLKLLAFQIGSEVSLSELATQLELSRETVDRYIDLLEKTFVVKRLGGYSRNLRQEVSKMDKIYFLDLGVRNAVIDNFKPLADRDDVGKLWENFLIIERLKRNTYGQNFTSSYFWRLHSGAELDYVEEDSGKVHGFEFKWKEKPARAPLSWKKNYPNSTFELVNRENFLSFTIQSPA